MSFIKYLFSRWFSTLRFWQKELVSVIIGYGCSLTIAMLIGIPEPAFIMVFFITFLLGGLFISLFPLYLFYQYERYLEIEANE